MKAKLLLLVSSFFLIAGCCSTYGIQGSVDCGGYSTCSSGCSTAYYPSYSACGGCGYSSSSCYSCSHRYGNTESYCGRWGDPGACENAIYGNIGGDESHTNWI